MIKGRRTSPDTAVGSFGNEATSTSGDETLEEDTAVVLRRRGGGKCLILDEVELLSGGGERAVSGEDGIEETGSGTTEVYVSGMVSGGGGAGICAECKVVTLTSSSAGTMVGFAVSSPLSRSPSSLLTLFSDIKRMGGSLDNPSYAGQKVRFPGIKNQIGE